MLIALDAMGGDKAPAEIVRGAVDAARGLGVEVALVGAPELIAAELRGLDVGSAPITIVPATEAIGMDESPAEAVRRRRGSSIVVGIELVKSGRAQAFVSAGNTGAVMAAATLHLGRLPGIERPALGAVMPAKSSGRVLLLDVGANADCKPSQLVQFAEMGRGYAQQALGVSEPRIGLLSIGEEDSKGNQLVLEAHQRLRKAVDMHFVGNVEGKDLASGLVDVVVTDGFTGNVIIKTAEGAADYIVHELRAALTSRLHYKLAALVLRPAFATLRRKLDYAEYGGAPLLGVRGLVLICHGRSDSRAIASAIRTAHDAAASDALIGLSASLLR